MVPQPPFAGRDKNGNAVYDLSGDEALAAAGDENAQKRLETARRLANATRASAQRELNF